MTSEKRKSDATNISWQHFWKSPHEGLIVVIFQGRVDDVVIIYAGMNVY